MICRPPERHPLYFVGDHSSENIANQIPFAICFFPNFHCPMELALYSLQQKLALTCVENQGVFFHFGTFVRLAVWK